MHTISKFYGHSLLAMSAGPLETAVNAAFGVERLGEYILADQRRRQVWHLWLHAHAQPCLEEDGSYLLHAKSSALLREALGWMGFDGTCPGLLKALGKLGHSALEKATYRNLCDILYDGAPGSKTIMHQEFLTGEVVNALHQLPNALRQKMIAEWAHENFADVEKLAFVLNRRPDLVSHAQKCLSKPASHVLYKLEEKASCGNHQAGFPIVWEGNEIIRPVKNPEELSALASVMNNCLDNYCERLSSGSFMLFVLVGRYPVAIIFERMAGVGWIMDEFRGPSNRAPTRSEYRKAYKGFTERGDFFLPSEHCSFQPTHHIDYAIEDVQRRVERDAEPRRLVVDG